MKLKDLNLTDAERITIYLHVGNDYFFVNCDKLSFNFFNDIDLDVDYSTFLFEHYLHIFTSFKKCFLNDVLATELINRAFEKKLSVLNSDFNLISKRDFVSMILGKI